eukprot:TRINITY_DN28014_c0_g1_i2.p1 TRINITY_DN28014_c0_g1~~TRINITY_DN28014_c0_g1_i2.p1  ORF type:complete len:604 (+),score=160.86 TRINITY_DN28014_c0_g1_i2:55-1812(+)
MACKASGASMPAELLHGQRRQRREHRRLLFAAAGILGVSTFAVSSAWAAFNIGRAPTSAFAGFSRADSRLHAAYNPSSRDVLLVSAAALAPGKYRALTKIRLRKDPDVSAEASGGVLVAGEEFEVEEALAPHAPGGLGYLRLSDSSGWAFDTGVAGRWAGKPIVEAVGGASAAPHMPKAAPPPPAAASSTTAPPAAATAPTSAPSPSAPVAAETVVAEPKTVEAEPLEPVVALATFGVDTLRLPDNMLGAGFEFVRFEVEGGKQPLTFMLGTAFPVNALTSKGLDLVDSGPSSTFQGGWLSAAAQAAANVDLKGVKFLGADSKINDLNNCQVLDFPQAQLAEQLGVEVHGVLGQPFFAEYDLDLDRYRGRAELYAQGGAASAGFYSNVKHLSGMSMPSGNVGVAVKGSIVKDEDPKEKLESFVGLIDNSAAHTVINWEAAKMLGFAGPMDPRLVAATKVLGAGKDGTPQELPVALVRLTLCSAPEGVKPMLLGISKGEWESTGGKGWYFEDLSGGDKCIDFGAVNVAIGDVLSLSVLDDSKIGPFSGAAAIIGQDILFQADRIVLNTKDGEMWLETGEMRDAIEM